MYCLYIQAYFELNADMNADMKENGHRVVAVNC
jgi:hypothetical protein